MTAYDRYFAEVTALLRRIHESERESIRRAAQLMVDSICADGVVRVFGTGHSHLIGEDAFYRAGGLVPVVPISEPHLMLHEGPTASSALERMSGLAEIVFSKYRFIPSDTLVVISNSGVNAVPVEMAKLAKGQGLKTIGIVSTAYCRATAERRGLAETLLDYVDVAVDNHLPPGDALVEIGDGLRMGPGSSITGSFIIHVMQMTAAEMLRERGEEPPVFVSANMPNAAEHNQRIMERYREYFWKP
ncbi:MAG: SIS domain-containing protein [Firmicutes bacterium]|jgi:uncharacterized phosphosugar-binding protein|nr:SIS domain-containing protein [Bacillota bacterium]